MRVHSLLAACFVAGACVLFAPSARADSFFVTFTNGTTPVGSRVQGATFEATTQATSSGPRPNPAKLEIDDWSLLQPTLEAFKSGAPLTAKVEFTTPNAQGQEVVYMIATYQTALLLRLAGTYDVAATPKLKEALEFSYDTVKYSRPPFTLTMEREAVRPLPSSSPIIRRIARQTANAQRVDDAYFQAPSFPGESADHPGQSRLLSFALEVKQTQVTTADRRSEEPRLLPVTITKAPGAATPVFQSASTTHKLVSPATITFVQHHGTLPDTTSKTVVLTNTLVKSDSVQVGGSSVETIVLAPQKITLTAGVVSTEIAGSPTY